MKNDQVIYKEYVKFLKEITVTYKNIDIYSIYKGNILGLLTLLAKRLNYEQFDEAAIQELNKIYYSNPSLEVTLALQLLNSLDLIERAEKYLNIEGGTDDR